MCAGRAQEGTWSMKRYLVATVAAMVLVVGARVSAHHSFAATYLEDQSVTIQGEIVQFLLRNPHSFVHVMVKEKDGTMNRYVVEWGSPAQLQGKVSRDTLKPGDEVIITGNPGRNAADHRVRLLTFKRPKDGWSWGILENERFD
jgi:Family of unknown function (DUF6152)